MKDVYDLYKAFRFKTLWDEGNPLPALQRVASEGARGGELNGVIGLTNVLKSIQNMETAAQRCFTNNVYTTDIRVWNFDQQSNPSVSSV